MRYICFDSEGRAFLTDHQDSQPTTTVDGPRSVVLPINFSDTFPEHEKILDGFLLIGKGTNDVSIRYMLQDLLKIGFEAGRQIGFKAGERCEQIRWIGEGPPIPREL